MATTGRIPLGADEWLASTSPQPALVVAGVPTSVAAAGTSETWRAPAAVRAALRRFPARDREAGVDLETLAVCDLGDWDVAGLGAEDAPGVVERHAREIPEGPTACFLGGDETVLGPLVMGLAQRRLGDVGVLTVGAHRAVPPTDAAGAFGGLIRSGLAPARVTRVGIHAFADPEDPPGLGGEVVAMDTIDEVGAQWVVASALNDLAESCSWVFVGIDLAVLDAAFAPGCPNARPGGMTPRQLIAASRAAGAHPAVRAADVVGVDPAKDPAGLTVMNAASVVLAFAAGVATRKAVR